MSTPLREFGSDPLDHVRRTLSLQLRAVLFDEGLVDSPDLPLRPIPADMVARAQSAASPILPTDNPTQKEAA